MKTKTKANGTRLEKLPKRAVAAKPAKAVPKHRKRARSGSGEPGMMSVPVPPAPDKLREALLTPFSFWTRAPLAMMELWLAPFAMTLRSGSGRS